ILPGYEDHPFFKRFVQHLNNPVAKSPGRPKNNVPLAAPRVLPETELRPAPSPTPVEPPKGPASSAAIEPSAERAAADASVPVVAPPPLTLPKPVKPSVESPFRKSRSAETL